MSLLDEINRKATELGIPLSVHLDITWRCNERCVHCYLDHDGKDEMTTVEIKEALRQVKECGAFFLSISGGEPLLRRDCFEILEYARALRMNVKLKTNAVMIGPEEAARVRKLGIEQVQISVYSHIAEVHDAITKLPGSFRRTMEAIQLLKENGVKVSITNVVMMHNTGHGKAVKQLADELGVAFSIDPSITPKLNGDWSIVSLGISPNELEQIYRMEEFVGNVGEFCSPVSTVDEDVLEGYGCSAGHSLAYISPAGDVFPCVQLPLLCGNLRKQTFSEIWKHSSALAELRSVRVRNLPICSHCNHIAYCSRCPGLAYMEGDLRGPSSLDCGKSYARTGIPASVQSEAGDRAACDTRGLVQVAEAPSATA